MSAWTSPREKGIFTSDQALEFTDQIHISSFPGLACSPPSMCGPSGTHGQCRQTGPGLRAEEARTLGARLPIVMGLRGCLSPLRLFSRDCESALKGREGLRHSPEKGSNRTLHLGCETWNKPPLWSLPELSVPFFRCVNRTNKTRQWEKCQSLSKEPSLSTCL